MRSVLSLIGVLSLMLPACATQDHYSVQRAQIDAWERVELARSVANARKYEALTESAKGGSDIARVAVAMALAGQIGTYQATQIPAVTDPSDGVYKWASLILPTATAITSGYFGYKLGYAQSNNARLQAEASYGAIATGFTTNAQIAGFIQAPQPNNTTTTTNTTTNTLSGTGVLGSGSYGIHNCNGGNSGSSDSGNTGSAYGGQC